MNKPVNNFKTRKSETGLWKTRRYSQAFPQIGLGYPREIHRGDSLKPFTMAIDWNGFPAGMIALRGDGVIAAGRLANEGTFRAALIKRILAERHPVETRP